tara:strand:+ start:265 stop:510 length:246 start_codon:yes stop_codon:yes gene_type:complete
MVCEIAIVGNLEKDSLDAACVVKAGHHVISQTTYIHADILEQLFINKIRINCKGYVIESKDMIKKWLGSFDGSLLKKVPEN